MSPKGLDPEILFATQSKHCSSIGLQKMHELEYLRFRIRISKNRENILCKSKDRRIDNISYDYKKGWNTYSILYAYHIIWNLKHCNLKFF